MTRRLKVALGHSGRLKLIFVDSHLAQVASFNTLKHTLGAITTEIVPLCDL